MENYRDDAQEYVMPSEYDAEQVEAQGTHAVIIEKRFRRPDMRGDRDDCLEGKAIAMAYVPWQCWKMPYQPEEALCRGTIFEELDKPFTGMKMDMGGRRR